LLASDLFGDVHEELTRTRLCRVLLSAVALLNRTGIVGASYVINSGVGVCRSSSQADELPGIRIRVARGSISLSLYKWWLKSAIKMMNGMGTPRNKSKMDRMARLLFSLNKCDVISLPAPNGRSKARAKRANQQREKYPQQCMRDGFAGSICSLLSLRKNIRHPLLSISLAESCSCRYELG
jgi:hypothetical protein